MDPHCLFCGGSGMKMLHRAGDPVPGQLNTTYASTTYVTCECCIFTTSPIQGSGPIYVDVYPEGPRILTRLERILREDDA